MSATDTQFNWDGDNWRRVDVGESPTTFAIGVMGEFAYVAATGAEGDEEFFTLGSNPWLALGEAEWIFAQDNPDYVVECLGYPAARPVVDTYLSRLSDEESRGEPGAILNELVASMGLPALPW